MRAWRRAKAVVGPKLSRGKDRGEGFSCGHPLPVASGESRALERGVLCPICSREHTGVLSVAPSRHAGGWASVLAAAPASGQQLCS